MLAAALLAATVGVQAHNVAVSISRDGPRPAAGRLERRAQMRLRRRFEAAGLAVRVQRFSTPRGHSRNVIGVWRAGRCLRVVMAHSDTVPPSPGADDNASGLGALAELAPRLAAIDPPCTVWLVATGAEERIYTGSPDHLGALALTEIVPRRRLRYALSLDEVGRGTHFRLRSPAARPRKRVERELMTARIDWQRDEETGNSDHREFELAGLRGVKLGVLDNPCRHTACDTPDRLQRRSFAIVLRGVEHALSRR
ncbi:MAG TPA: M28 family peptidase [Solirubrobacteraceae bacterium]|nr:M28 family peptidase [Solirubrobacteraceae bacterium]